MNIYIDFDGVIVNTVKAVVELYKEDYKRYDGFEDIKWQDIDTWNFEELKLASKEAIDGYFNTSRLFDKLEFMSNALDTILELAKENKVYIVTMGEDENIRLKEKWFKRILGGKEAKNIELIGCDFKEYSDKSHIDMSGALFIDDSYNNLSTSNASWKLLFGEVHEWNRDWHGDKVKDWNEVLEYIRKHNIG